MMHQNEYLWSKDLITHFSLILFKDRLAYHTHAHIWAMLCQKGGLMHVRILLTRPQPAHDETGRNFSLS